MHQAGISIPGMVKGEVFVFEGRSEGQPLASLSASELQSLEHRSGFASEALTINLGSLGDNEQHAKTAT